MDYIQVFIIKSMGIGLVAITLFILLDAWFGDHWL